MGLLCCFSSTAKVPTEKPHQQVTVIHELAAQNAIPDKSEKAAVHLEPATAEANQVHIELPPALPPMPGGGRGKRSLSGIFDIFFVDGFPVPLDTPSFIQVFQLDESNPFLPRLLEFYDTTGSETYEIGIGEFLACSAFFAQNSSIDLHEEQEKSLHFVWSLFDWDQEGRLSAEKFLEILREIHGVNDNTEPQYNKTAVMTCIDEIACVLDDQIDWLGFRGIFMECFRVVIQGALSLYSVLQEYTVPSLVLLDHIQTSPKIISTALKCRTRFSAVPQKYDLALVPSMQVDELAAGESYSLEGEDQEKLAQLTMVLELAKLEALEALQLITQASEPMDELGQGQGATKTQKWLSLLQEVEGKLETSLPEDEDEEDPHEPDGHGDRVVNMRSTSCGVLRSAWGLNNNPGLDWEKQRPSVAASTGMNALPRPQTGFLPSGPRRNTGLGWGREFDLKRSTMDGPEFAQRQTHEGNTAYSAESVVRRLTMSSDGARRITRAFKSGSRSFDADMEEVVQDKSIITADSIMLIKKPRGESSEEGSIRPRSYTDVTMRTLADLFSEEDRGSQDSASVEEGARSLSSEKSTDGPPLGSLRTRSSSQAEPSNGDHTASRSKRAESGKGLAAVAAANANKMAGSVAANIRKQHNLRRRNQGLMNVQHLEEVSIDVEPKTEKEKLFIARAVQKTTIFKKTHMTMLKERLIDIMYKIEVKAGETIVTEGDTTADEFFVVESGECLFSERRNGILSTLKDAKGPIKFGPATIIEEFTVLLSIPPEFTVVAHTDMVLWGMKRATYAAVQAQHDSYLEEKLHAVPRAARLPKVELQKVASLLKYTTVSEGKIIVEAGARCRTLYILQEGRVEVINKKHQLVDILIPGSTFGDHTFMEHYDPKPSPVVLRAAQQCRFWQIDYDTVADILRRSDDAMQLKAASELPLFSSLTTGQRRMLLTETSVAHLQPLERLFSAGDPCKIYVAISGRLLRMHAWSRVENKAKVLEEKRSLSNAFSSVLINLNEALIPENDMVFDGCSKVGQLDTAQWAMAASTQGAVVMSVSKEALGHIGISVQALILSSREAFLRTVKELEGLSKERISSLAVAVKERQFISGAVLAELGAEQESAFVYIVQEGAVHVVDKGAKLLHTIKEGGLIKDLAKLLKGAQEASCVAVGQTKLYAIPQEEFAADTQDLARPGTAAAPAGVVITDLHKVRRLVVLGEGGYAQVLLVRYNSVLYAMKVLNKAHIIKKQLVEHVYRERDIGLSIRSNFVTRVHHTAQDSKNIYLFMDPVLGTEVFHYMEKNCSTTKRGIPESSAAFFAACVVNALEYLHSRNVVYRDLKLENMLLDQAGFVRLTDLGFAKKLTNGKTYTTCGTLDYMAPEMVNKTGHSEAVDWWSLGVVIFEMVRGLPPFYNTTSDRQKVEWIQRARVNFPPYMSPKCIHLVRQLLQLQPHKRVVDIAELKKHPWFADINWQKLADQTHKTPYVPQPEETLYQMYIPGIMHRAHMQNKGYELTPEESKLFEGF
uniref:cGMP-dependent protein kinase n=1 Tax=Pyramimonas obovata TaxID=1411642 RepID=A0A7S0R8V7_9CHLO|mmetsp:Transcript_27894/g.61013  ORF Transcript_27894/g.61013 Transcript_27894/m.61013 type:complete len:1511 (+) Transcript_27894:226-4758(+)|eukprot:CAMPEP_0118948852 /NCGR_PEP_ID=MMETSP1169-20130426/48564_1 /TAXON_ID=36882 /ORGANISM="Pyramimonas obovata, Strain CCMP722" /LENGTH=1510 /DNA_ID=CAMNT_0006895369 /DNA_START=169 /DNA_END=4701 /DNA_ORIENTATION=+